MDIKRGFRYFAGVDVMNNAIMRESAVYFEHELDPNEALPLEAGLGGAAEILGIRVASMLKQSGAILCRAAGVDALYRVATRTDFPE